MLITRLWYCRFLLFAHDYTQSWAVSPRMGGVGWGGDRCVSLAHVWEAEQGGARQRPGCPAALPSGGRCAAVSASPPAGTPCLSGPGEAPRWKDKGQGETQGPPGLGGGFQTHSWGGTGGPGPSGPSSSGEPCSCWGPEGVLEEGLWGKPEASPPPCCAPPREGPSVDVDGGCGSVDVGGACGRLSKAVCVPAPKCALPPGTDHACTSARNSSRA